MKTTEKSTTIKSNIESNLNKSLEDTCQLQAQQIEELTTKLNWYEEQFRLSKQKLFGTSSEQSDSDQLSIFNEAEKESRPEVEEPTVVSHFMK